MPKLLRYARAGHAGGRLAQSGARDRLAFMHAENVSVGAAFGLSYADLTPGPRRLFRRLGVVPEPDIDAYAAAALDGTDLATARRHLDELYDQHLITEPAPGRYQLHDLLREHARTLAANDDPAQASEAAGRLLDYYLDTTLAAAPHFTTRAIAGRRPPPHRRPGQAPDMPAPEQAAAWLDAEQANLYAAAEYAADRAWLPHAIAIPLAMSGFLTARGRFDQAAALHRGAVSSARRAGDRHGEAAALAELGFVQRATGDYRAAAASLAEAAAISSDIGDRPGHAHALVELGFLEAITGDYPAAIATQQQALALARDTGDRLTQATAFNHLGFVQHLTGDYPAAAASQQHALTLFGELGNQLGQASARNDLGLVQQQTGDYPAAAASHQQALALFGDAGNPLGQAEALNRLGELATRTSATRQARGHHAQALAIARDLGAAPEEARALEGLGQSHLRDGDPGEAATRLRQALTIYQRISAADAERVQKILHDHGTLKPAGGGQAAQGVVAQPRRAAAEHARDA